MESPSQRNGLWTILHKVLSSKERKKKEPAEVVHPMTSLLEYPDRLLRSIALNCGHKFANHIILLRSKIPMHSFILHTLCLFVESRQSRTPLVLHLTWQCACIKTVPVFSRQDGTNKLSAPATVDQMHPALCPISLSLSTGYFSVLFHFIILLESQYV